MAQVSRTPHPARALAPRHGEPAARWSHMDDRTTSQKGIQRDDTATPRPAGGAQLWEGLDADLMPMWLNRRPPMASPKGTRSSQWHGHILQPPFFQVPWKLSRDHSLSPEPVRRPRLGNLEPPETRSSLEPCVPPPGPLIIVPVPGENRPPSRRRPSALADPAARPRRESARLQHRLGGPPSASLRL